jgi:hypothetical protein
MFFWFLSQSAHYWYWYIEKLLLSYTDFASCYFAKSVFDVLSVFWWNLGSFKYEIVSSANRDLTSSPHIQIPFISSNCLIALVRNSKTILNKSGESGSPCFFLDFRGNGFSFSLFSLIVAICLSHTGFIILRYVPSIPTFFRPFILKRCWFLSKAFSISIEMVMWFLSLTLLICCITFVDLHMLKHPYIPGMKLTWS